MLIIFIVITVILLLLTRGLSLKEKLAVFAQGAGEKDLLLMVWIFMLAGAFAASAKGMGAVEATVNLTLTFLPANYVLALASLALAYCSSAQKISIRQEQSGQVQETVIEQSGRVESLSRSFYLLPPAH